MLYKQLHNHYWGLSNRNKCEYFLCLLDFVLGHLTVMARGAELKRMDKDKELPVTVRLLCGGLAGAISQTSKLLWY